MDREMMKGRAGGRTWRFEKRLEEGKGGGELTRKCLEEMKERWRRGKLIGKWEQGKEDSF